MSTVRLQFQKFGMRPPPFVDLLFQADLQNTSVQPLWFLLPLYLDESSDFQLLLASAVEIFDLPGTGRVRIARFLGNGDFQLMRLPPGARVRIHEFPITFVGEPPRTEIVIPALLAERLNIGEHPADEWLPVDLTSMLEAEVTEEPGAIIASKDTPGARPVAVTLVGTEFIRLQVPLKKS
jgi:hypothetical protein